MKNKYMTFVELAVAALATSCTTDDLAGQQQTQNQSSSQTVTLTASVDDDNTTRVGMTKKNNTAEFYWHKGDAISVLTVDTDDSFSLEKLYTEDADGTTTAKFKGEVRGTVTQYALYPYNEKHKFDVRTVTVIYNLPAAYTYNKVDGNIFSKDGSTYPANSTNMPMYGDIGIDNSTVSFKHIGGLAVIRIDKMPAASGTLTVTADQKLSGDFEVDGLNCEIATTSTHVVDADKKVTFDFKGANENKVGVFYLPLATGDYTNVEIKLNSGSVTQTMNWSKLTVERAKVTALPVVVNPVINNHVFVDLGLPSGLLWAETNIGADKATDYGNYFAWGETTTKDCYDQAHYKYIKDEGGGNYSYTEYGDNPYHIPGYGDITLKDEDDAAYTGWGSPCYMPTQKDFEELLNNCNRQWTEQDGVKGFKITSRTNGNSIFLPAAGYYYFKASRVGECGFYWSKTYFDTSIAYELYFNNNPYISSSNGERCEGHSIRPVAKKQ